MIKVTPDIFSFPTGFFLSAFTDQRANFFLIQLEWGIAGRVNREDPVEKSVPDACLLSGTGKPASLCYIDIMCQRHTRIFP
jgi:hypothetical protein